MLIDQNIGGLNVSMNDASVMGMSQGICNGKNPARCLLDSDLPPNKPISKRTSTNKLTHKKAISVFNAYVIDGKNRGMLQTGDSTSFSEKCLL